jgi:hypothetical protein
MARLLIFLLLFAGSSCEQDKGTDAQDPSAADDGSISLEAEKKEDGSYQAGVINSSSPLTIAIDDGSAIDGAILRINPETLSEVTNITLIEGAPLTSAASKVNVDGKDGFVAAGPAVVLSSSSFEDPKNAMPLSLAISSGQQLQNSFSDDDLAILYMAVLYGEQFKIVFGIIPRSEVKLRTDSKGRKKIDFEAPYFGSYQPVYVPPGANKKFSVEINEDIISKSGSVVITEGGDKTPPVAGSNGKLQILSLNHDQATIGFDLATDNFSKDINLAYLGYVSLTNDMNTIESIESKTPIGDYKRKISAIVAENLDHSQTYFVNVIVRDEMNNKAFYQSVKVETPTPNFPPTIVERSPTKKDQKLHYKKTMQFEVHADDKNASDTLTYNWSLNGDLSQHLKESGTKATFKPQFEHAGLNVVEVEVSDGVNNVKSRWNILVFTYNPDCDNLDPGHICTLVGSADVGSGSKPTEDFVEKIKPASIVGDGQGNYFFSDIELNVVWFYNRSNSPVTRIGKSVPAKTLAIVAGTGAPGGGEDGLDSLAYSLNLPYGLAYHAGNDLLFVSSYQQNKVVRFESDGVGRVIFGIDSTLNNESTNTDGADGTTHNCRNPAGLALDEGADELYIACKSLHAIKKATNVSSATLTDIDGYVVLGAKNGSGVILNSHVDGTVGGGGVAKVRDPFAIALGPNGEIFFSDTNQCRVRVINQSGGVLNYFSNAISIPVGESGSLMDSGCGFTKGIYSSARVRYPYGIELVTNGLTVEGLFVTESSRSSIGFLNFSGSSKTFGGKVVDDEDFDFVFGTSQSGFNGDSFSGYQTNLKTPFGIDLVGNELVVADQNNYRVRGLDVSVADGDVSTQVGTGASLKGYSTDTPSAADSIVMNSPKSAEVIGSTLYFSDLYNRRIKAMDLKSGVVRTMAGERGFYDDGGDESANTTTFRDLSGMSSNGGVLYVVDENGNSGVEKQCKVRAINLTLENANVFGTTISPGFIGDIYGNFGLGCESWSTGSFVGKDAKSVPIREPVDVAILDDQLVVTTNSDHCILRADNNGLTLDPVGDCDSAGDVDDTFASGNILLNRPYGIAKDPKNFENFFFIDQSTGIPGKLKYANYRTTPVNVLGVNVPASSVATLLTIATVRLRDVASIDNQVCIAAGDYTVSPNAFHSVVCYDRNSATEKITQNIGPKFSETPIARRPIDRSQERADGKDATLYAPNSIVFDQDGNLYIVELESNLIRKVAKWW